VADTLSGQALAATLRGAHAQAESMARDSVALFRELGDTGRLAEALWVLGVATTFQGAHAPARASLEESLALRRERGDRRGAGFSLSALGFVALGEGDLDRAVALGDESLALLRETGERGQQANVLALLGNVALWRGQRGRGADLLTESLALFRATGTHTLLPWAIEGMALVAAAQEDLASAARLYSAMTAVARAMEFAMVPLNRAAYEDTLARAQQQLGGDAYAAASAEGQSVTIDQAITLALALTVVEG
jgi:hypothetical protein